jgi:integrase
MKRGAPQEHYKIRVILNHPIADLSLDRLSPAEIAKYRDGRLRDVAGDTVRRELALVQHCLELARREWGLGLLLNPVRQIKMPTVGRARERRATADELTQLLAGCAGNRCYWLPAMIRLAVETGMRRSELLCLRWTDVDLGLRTIYVANPKNGHPRTVPLSSDAVEALAHVPQAGDKLFPVTANAFRLAWERLKRRAGITGLRFHDLRHEAR